VRLIELHVDGFGKLADATFAFDPRMTVVFGPNEAGKSTLADAIVAALYGIGRERDGRRPWLGARFGARLRYVLADGREFEVQRDFERDPKGARVYDRDGNDVTADASNGRAVSPGAAHLGVPLEVFVNATCVRQGAVRIEGARAEIIGASLAQALDGGPREDAALGALGRLERAVAEHVGTKRATVNAPLRKLRERMSDASEQADRLRAKLRALDELRARRDNQTKRATELLDMLRVHERRARNVRAAALRDRLASLREIRDHLAALQAQRADYDDVAEFPSDRVGELQSRFERWRALEAVAIGAAQEESAARLTPALLAELDERRADGGALDDDAFARLQAAGRAALLARDKATHSASAAASARRVADGGSTALGAAAASGGLLALLAGVLAILHVWIPAGAVALVALVCMSFALAKTSRRRAAVGEANVRQAEADAATGSERRAAAEIAAVLDPLRVASIDELARRRHRARELTMRREESSRAAARRDETRRAADDAGRAFDRLADELTLARAQRAERLAEARARESRRAARDGIELQLGMLGVRRGDVLGSDDESTIESDLAELVADGAVPAPLEGMSPHAFEAQRADLERRCRAAAADVSGTAAELRAAETQIGDLAALDEEVASLGAESARLQAFERAVLLARAVIDERTREAHQKFARRLEDYSTGTFLRVTDGRYADLRVDPTTLTVRLRVPETGAILDVERLSAGTREQAHLIVRLAMARMFAEGAEVLPLLLDDPFAFWDADRIARGLPVLQAATAESQVVLFTASESLAAAAAANGATRIDLTAAAVPLER
jgi:DNA repair exonuclease SbcCD ATPase subunit